MKWVKSHLMSVNAAISASAVMCFVQFISGLAGIFRTGSFNGAAIEQLLASFDGFESVILFFVMLAINKNRSKEV